MANAVIFDFYGTLAHWRDLQVADYAAAFADHGYELPGDVRDAYFAKYDGVAHFEHSVSEAAYEAWVRGRLHELTVSCGVAEGDRSAVVATLRALDQSPMVAYGEAEPTMRALREKGWTIGVCSNWGWQLDPFLHQVGLAELVYAAVTSARAGARKPHPSIYGVSAEALGIEAHHAVFVGDSFGPDVQGPREVGMTAVHVWREEERHGQSPPELPEGAHRIASLAELLPLLGPAAGVGAADR